VLIGNGYPPFSLAAETSGALDFDSADELAPPPQLNATIISINHWTSRSSRRYILYGLKYQDALKPTTERYTGSEALMESELKHPSTSLNLGGTPR
jgi:hypothetical protein